MLCKAITAKGKACQKKPVDNQGFCRMHSPDLSLRPSDGKAFEEEVAKILRVLGYYVERNKSIKHCQIDLYAEHSKGVIAHKLMVECKDYGDDQLVGINEMKVFAGALAAARGHGLVHQGLFVTTNGFTAPAKELATASGIELTTYTELSTQLVDFDSYIDRVISDFYQLPVGNCYVDLSGTETEDFEGNEDIDYYRPIDTFIDRCLHKDGQTKLALLGNFGTGKSTFCRKYARDLAKKYKKDKTGRIPVIISLKDYDSKLFIHELILNILQNRYGVNITQSTFYALQRLGKFIFLFDGFDEMDARANQETISANLRELAKISDIKENKFILTCRTHFFRSKVQVEVLEDFGILYIPEWGETELKEFLQKKFGKHWKKNLRRISGTHNLPELAQTPLFLEMIAETLPKLGDHVKRIELYKVYTDTWIKNQTRHKGAVLSTEERRSFIKELAIKLYSENRLSCHYSELLGILKLYLQRMQFSRESRFVAEDAAQLDHLRHDVQTCTFLVRNTAGDYSFKHTSFLEFFVAQTIAEELDKGITSNLEKNILPVTIRGFLLDFLKESPSHEIIVNSLKEIEGGVLKDNMVMLASLLKINVPVARATSGKEEGTLFSQFIQGSTNAFSQLFNEYYYALCSICIRRVSDEDIAKEIVADAFLNLWTNRESVESLREVVRYLKLIIDNKCSDYLRRKDKERKFLNDIESISPTIEFNEIEYKTGLVSIEDAVKKLPERQRSVIQLYAEGYSASEIAKKMEISMQLVRVSRSKAISHLRGIITGRD